MTKTNQVEQIPDEAIFLTLALASAMRKRLEEVEKNLRVTISENHLLDEGDKRPVYVHGTNISTVARSRESAPSVTITDIEALDQWAHTHHVQLPIKHEKRLIVTNEEALRAKCAEAGILLDAYTTVDETIDAPAWLSGSTTLLDMLDSAGVTDFPDGIEVKKGRPSAVSVRQSETQKQALLSLLPAAADIVRQIETYREPTR